MQNNVSIPNWEICIFAACHQSSSLKTSITLALGIVNSITRKWESRYNDFVVANYTMKSYVNQLNSGC
jgi:hypothetical protein